MAIFSIALRGGVILEELILRVDAALSQDNSWGHGGARDNASTQPDKASR